MAVYFQVRELEGGNVLVNYDKDGHLLGIELLAPARASVLDKITRGHHQAVRQFVRRSVPRQMAGAVS